MYRAKERGRGCYQIFDEAMHRRALGRLELETALHRAIERKELELHFQRIVSLDTHMPAGLEALLRWRHPQRGMMSADTFVPLAEETGMILPIGWWAIEEACRLVNRWRKENWIGPDMYVSINLSGRQFAQADLVEKMADVLARTGAAPNLNVEITETVIMEQDEGAVARRLERLRKLGVALMIDDFGTGHSSLSRLHEFPIDTLKIDRSFVARLRNGGGPEVCRAIVALATNMDMDVVAEGIEDARQVATLRDLGCQRGQGFYFSRPMDAAATERSLLPQV
jgi:EAL domain-containing protein (putative c-di-GMP-specific phosphodiesterase class I)